MLRIYLLLPIYHEFINSKNYEKLHTPFSRAVLSLTKISQNILSHWWAEQSIEYFERLVENYKNVVMHILTFKFAKNSSNSSDVELPSVTYERNLDMALRFMVNRIYSLFFYGHTKLMISDIDFRHCCTI